MPVGDNQDNSRDMLSATVIPFSSEVEPPGPDGGGGGEAFGLGESYDHTTDVTVCAIDAKMVVFYTSPRQQRRSC